MHPMHRLGFIALGLAAASAACGTQDAQLSGEVLEDEGSQELSCWASYKLPGAGTSRWLPQPGPLAFTTDGGSPLTPTSYQDVIHQFGVVCNPRYRAGNGQTWCNIFAWDVSRALGAEVPHWVETTTGKPTLFEINAYLKGQQQELSANKLSRWMLAHVGDSAYHRWSLLPDGGPGAQKAQELANQGVPAFGLWLNDPDANGVENGSGHIAWVVPTSVPYDAGQGPMVAQAGLVNFDVTAPSAARQAFFSSRLGAAELDRRLLQIRYYALLPEPGGRDGGH